MSCCGHITNTALEEIGEFIGNGEYVPNFLRDHFGQWTIVNIDEGKGRTIPLTSAHLIILKNYIFDIIKIKITTFEKFLEFFDGQWEYLLRDFDTLFRNIIKHGSVCVVWSW